MPNHVQNNVFLNGSPDRVAALLKEVQNDAFGMGTVDFNKIIPMPESLIMEAGSETDKGLKAYRAFVSEYMLGGGMTGSDLLPVAEEKEEEFRRLHPEITDNQWKLGKTAFHNQIQYGAPTWYEWSIRQWGTKWNAYGYEDLISSGRMDTDMIRFQTAWSAPHPILGALSRKYPDIELTHEWADEDIGSNCGKRVYLHGEMTEEYIPETDKEAIEWAIQVQGWEDASEIGLCLNAAHTNYLYLWDAEYERIHVCGIPALFAKERLTDEDIPDGFYRYAVNKSAKGYVLTQAEPPVRDNFSGTIMTGKPLDLGSVGSLALHQDNCEAFPDSKSVSFGQFMTEEYTHEAEEPEKSWEVQM